MRWFVIKSYSATKIKRPLRAVLFLCRNRGSNPVKPRQWRGGTDSWGESRVWLEPAKETNLYGRSGFSIHGGAVPGSAVRNLKYINIDSA